jgi:hypothetical protein
MAELVAASAPPVAGDAVASPITAEQKADLLEKLALVSKQWKADDFWKTLANPVDRAMAALEKDDVKYACETLDALMMHLPGGIVGPLKGLPTDGILSEQKKVVRVCRDALRKALTPERPPPPPQSEPIVFEQHPWNSEATLRIKVPPGTKSKDASVDFAFATEKERRDGHSQHIKVVVKDHDAQPHVICGVLFEKVVEDDCAWFLEGEGERRILVIHLEKHYKKKEWPQLLKALGPPEAGSIESGDDFWSRHDREHAERYKKMGLVRKEP